MRYCSLESGILSEELGKEKNTKENDFYMFGCLMKIPNQNQIQIKLFENAHS